MKIYTAYIKDKDIILIAEGFSLSALLFTLLWSIYHKLWGLSALLVIFKVAIMTLVTKDILTPEASILLQVIISLACGIFGSEWQRIELFNKGYNLTDIVCGDNAFQARIRLLDRMQLEIPCA